MTPSKPWIEGEKLTQEFKDRFGPHIACRKLYMPKQSVTWSRWIQIMFNFDGRMY